MLTFAHILKSIESESSATVNRSAVSANQRFRNDASGGPVAEGHSSCLEMLRRMCQASHRLLAPLCE